MNEKVKSFLSLFHDCCCCSKLLSTRVYEKEESTGTAAKALILLTQLFFSMFTLESPASARSRHCRTQPSSYCVPHFTFFPNNQLDYSICVYSCDFRGGTAGAKRSLSLSLQAQTPCAHYTYIYISFSILQLLLLWQIIIAMRNGAGSRSKSKKNSSN